MKKLFVVFCLVLIASCGADTQSEFEFYEQFYGGCVNLCEQCASLNEACNVIPNYDAGVCVQQHWAWGDSVAICIHWLEKMDTEDVFNTCVIGEIDYEFCFGDQIQP